MLKGVRAPGRISTISAKKVEHRQQVQQEIREVAQEARKIQIST